MAFAAPSTGRRHSQLARHGSTDTQEDRGAPPTPRPASESNPPGLSRPGTPRAARVRLAVGPLLVA
jgi:hypothetical protein